MIDPDNIHHFNYDQAAKEVENHPWDAPTFVFAPGRYYYGMGFALIAGGGILQHGGDLNLLIWRYEHTPLDWVCSMRMRIYAEENNDAWDGKDRKRWFAGKFHGTEAEVVQWTQENMRKMMLFGKPDWIVFQGAHEKVLEILEHTERPWMHRKKINIGREPNG